MKISKEYLIEELNNYVKNNDIPRSLDFKNKNGLRSVDSYKKYLGVHFFSDIFVECGIYLDKSVRHDMDKAGRKLSTLSKGECFKIIFAMAKNMQRPLKYDDFRHPSIGDVGIRSIRKYWGTLNNMKKDLGLKIIQENMSDKKISIDDAKNVVLHVCNIVKNEGRDIVLVSDISLHSNYSGDYLRSVFKKNGENIRDFIESNGYKLKAPGNGLRYKFHDGEIASSIYEFYFSKLLRESSYVFNATYFRNVRYRKFIDKCDRLIDCDYVVLLKNGENKFIEIAGMLKDREKKYYSGTKFEKNSKQLYAMKLRLKERLLSESNLNYTIFFPYVYKNNYIKEMKKIISQLND